MQPGIAVTFSFIDFRSVFDSFNFGNEFNLRIEYFHSGNKINEIESNQTDGNHSIKLRKYYNSKNNSVSKYVDTRAPLSINLFYPPSHQTFLLLSSLALSPIWIPLTQWNGGQFSFNLINQSNEFNSTSLTAVKFNFIHDWLRLNWDWRHFFATTNRIDTKSKVNYNRIW